MNKPRLAIRLFSMVLLFSLALSFPISSAAQDGINPDPNTTPAVEPAPAPTSQEPVSSGQPTDGLTSAGQIPEGLSAAEWASIQAQIAAAAGAPASPDADGVSAHTPGYRVAPLRGLISADGAAIDNFGWSVDIDGEQMIVGSPYSDIMTRPSQGAAYLFRRNQNGEDQWGQVTKIVAPDGLGSDLFGYDVAIHGDVVAIGAPGDRHPTGGQGSVYIFGRNVTGAEGWGYVNKLVAGGTNSADFGYAVDLSGDKLVVGDPFYTLGSNEIGQAYIFYRNQFAADAWGQVQTLTNANPAADDRFGAAVAIEGDTCAIGSPYRDESSMTDGGAVYIFARNYGGDNAWAQVEELSGGVGSYVYTNDRFGSSLALDHNVLVVGSPWKSSVASTSGGAVFVFAPGSFADEWEMQSMILPSDRHGFFRFWI